MQLSLQDMYMFSIAPVDYDNGLCMKALYLVMSLCVYRIVVVCGVRFIRVFCVHLVNCV